ARERRALPAPVVLEDFVLTTNIGGFSGRVSSIRDWTSRLRFVGGPPAAEAVSVSTNNPKSYAGLSFFQAFWDAPQADSSGLTFTGLGVGNRVGVTTQLFGSILAAVGMIYAFYIKPIIKRRRRERVIGEMATGRYGERAQHHAQAREAARNGAAQHQEAAP
ncbi:MAG TPA: hypothetical protein DEB06_07240, partial [Phycisphaerales bacterium]|nr:hypothetical protein [Phycisphaerales bacterium]